jgi:hypothetical protein
VTTAVGWRAIYERLFEKGPESFSQGERETIRDAIEEAWAAGAAASPSREAPAPTHWGPRFDAEFRCLRHKEHACPSCLAYALGDANAEIARLASREAPGDLAALVDALCDAVRSPPTGEGASWMNEHQARACPRCAGDTRARHIFEWCARAALLSAVARLSRNEGTALAPWYEADGSTVMLPVAEVERRRKLAAKVLREARLAVEQCGHPILAAALRALDAASPPPPTPGAKP